MKEKEEQSKRQTEPVYSKTYTVEPAEGNGQQELPLTLLAKRILEVATLHAESWGVGYSTLIKTGKYGYSPGSPSKCTVIRSSTSIILYKHGSKGITSIFIEKLRHTGRGRLSLRICPHDLGRYRFG